jgi:hypothetical protein
MFLKSKKTKKVFSGNGEDYMAAKKKRVKPANITAYNNVWREFETKGFYS